MYSFGRIIFDKDGTIKRLQDQAKKELKRPFEKPNNVSIELAKYNIWDLLDGLKELKINQSPAFNLSYFSLLEVLLKTYGYFVSTEVASSAKIYKYLTDSSFRERYNIPEFPDSHFVAQFLECLEIPSLSKIEVLSNYALDKMGGFEIDGWKLRSSVE